MDPKVCGSRLDAEGGEWIARQFDGALQLQCADPMCLSEGGGPTLENELWTHAPAGLSLARIEILVNLGAIHDEISETLRSSGWFCEDIQWRDLERVERENWNLVVVGGERVTQEILSSCARASRNPRTRVLVVTTDREPQPIADALRAGADDYLVYPFEPEELQARARSLVNFSLTLPARRRLGTIGLDFAARTVFDGPARVALSPAEWDVLIALLDAEGEPVPLADVAGIALRDGTFSSSVASTVSRLRRKVRAGGIRGLEIDTISGRGYALHFRQDSLE